MYTTYCQGFENSATILKSLVDKNKEFRKFHDDISSNENVGETLDSFLILPIQRIPRYNLLLNELFKVTPVKHLDFHLLKKAKEEM
jgi:hypothetical protein